MPSIFYFVLNIKTSWERVQRIMHVGHGRSENMIYNYAIPMNIHIDRIYNTKASELEILNFQADFLFCL